MNTSDTKALAQASLFRRMWALCRTMRKTRWHFHNNNSIRCGSACPLTFAAYVSGKYHTLHSSHWRSAGKQLGFTVQECGKIVDAADDHPRALVPDRMRRILLRAAGLKEQRLNYETPASKPSMNAPSFDAMIAKLK
jgi:hypothetical protein